MKKYFLLLLSAMFALVSLTNCNDDEKETTNAVQGAWKYTSSTTVFDDLLEQFTKGEEIDNYAYFTEEYMYTAALYEGKWEVARMKYSYADGKLSDSQKNKLDAKIEGNTLSLSMAGIATINYEKSSLPAGLKAAIEKGEYSDVESFTDSFEIGDIESEEDIRDLIEK